MKKIYNLKVKIYISLFIITLFVSSLIIDYNIFNLKKNNLVILDHSIINKSKTVIKIQSQNLRDNYDISRNANPNYLNFTNDINFLLNSEIISNNLDKYYASEFIRAYNLTNPGEYFTYSVIDRYAMSGILLLEFEVFSSVHENKLHFQVQELLSKVIAKNNKLVFEIIDFYYTDNEIFDNISSIIELDSLKLENMIMQEKISDLENPFNNKGNIQNTKNTIFSTFNKYLKIQTILNQKNNNKRKISALIQTINYSYNEEIADYKQNVLLDEKTDIEIKTLKNSIQSNELKILKLTSVNKPELNGASDDLFLKYKIKRLDFVNQINKYQVFFNQYNQSIIKNNYIFNNFVPVFTIISILLVFIFFILQIVFFRKKLENA